MKRLSMRFYLFIFLLFSIVTTNYGQEKQLVDTLQNNIVNPAENSQPVKKLRKNTIMVNVTNPSLISSKFFTVGYERILPNNQSFTVSVGSFSIPKFTEDITDSLGLNTDYKDKGFHFSADYRFYLRKHNKFAPPSGLYIGPYYAFNNLKREVDWYLDGTTFNGNVMTDLKLNIHTLGFEMGYQFIFWDRMTVDMIFFGPGFGSYKLDTDLKTTLTPEQESEFFDKLNQYLEEHLPGYDWVIDSGEFSKKGSYKTWDAGYRYSIRVGFRF
jgi:hypothetical protein